MNSRQQVLTETADNLLENAKRLKSLAFGESGSKLSPEDRDALQKVIFDLLRDSDGLYDASMKDKGRR